MNAVKQILLEIRHRPAAFILATLAIVATVAFVVGYLITSAAALNETKRVTRDMGFNIRIIPKSADLDEFWIHGFSSKTMPESTIDKLASYDNVFMSYNHLVGSLQGFLEWEGRQVIVTGLTPAIAAKGKKPMGYSIKEGRIHLGYRVAQRMEVKKGDSVQIKGRSFTVDATLVESGSDDDIRVFMSLKDAQDILNSPGQINEIKAIDCLCLTQDQDPLSLLRAELEKALPEAQVFQIQHLADARARQRQMGEKMFEKLTPFLLIASAAWVGIMAVMNVKERKHEIGILRAMGHGSGRIAILFLGRAACIGLAGGLVGYAIGNVLALKMGASIFQVTQVKLNHEWLIWALLVPPFFSGLAGFIPAMMAVAQDPAESLRES